MTSFDAATPQTPVNALNIPSLATTVPPVQPSLSTSITPPVAYFNPFLQTATSLIPPPFIPQTTTSTMPVAPLFPPPPFLQSGTAPNPPLSLGFSHSAPLTTTFSSTPIPVSSIPYQMFTGIPTPNMPFGLPPYYGSNYTSPYMTPPYNFVPLHPPFQQHIPIPIPTIKTNRSPFVKELLDYEIPSTAKLPTLKVYNGTTCPDSHIDTYEWHMTSLKLDQRFWCTYFPTTLDGNAGAWFKSLAPNSIYNFEQLKQLFLTNFMQLRKYRGDNHSIMGCKQREGESVKEYFRRFNKVTLDVPGQDDRMVTGAFTWGLLPGPLSRKFLGKPPQTRHELKERVERFLRQEEGTVEKQSYLKATSDQYQKRHDRYQHRGRRNDYAAPSFRGGRPPRRYNPFSREDQRNRNEDVYVVKENTSKAQDNRNRYCEYHKSRAHDTTDCAMLKREMEEKQLKGNLVETAKKLREQYEANRNTGKNKKDGQGIERGLEILAIRTSHKRISHASDEVECPLQKNLNLDFSVNDPRPDNWQGDDPLIIVGYVKNVKIHRVYIDTGSAADIIHEHCFNLLPQVIKDTLQPATRRLVGFTGHSIWPVGTIYLAFTLRSCEGRLYKTVLLEFVVVRAPSEHNMILGRPGLLKFGAIPSTVHGTLKFKTFGGTACVLATNPQQLRCYQVMQPTDIVRPTKKVRSEESGDKAIINPAYPEQLVKVGNTLPADVRDAVITLLRKYKHVFAWQPSDMVGVDRSVIEHSLNVKAGSSAIKQKKRSQAGERNAAINDEVSKLVAAGILREAIFPDWISNPVMVKKHDGSWRMCIDYTDLNKACPKDCYPLPEIDQKVESLQGFRWKCFLDAYKGYHQIQMKKEDEEKTAFYTDRGTFCYQKMPFGLKNAGATYQRLVDRIFRNQIGRNIEVYVDDMVIKSQETLALTADIEETFKTLEETKMKLNPSKCVFGVEEGQFLGYYVTNQGVLPNPAKLQDTIETKTPTTVKEMQGLNGKLTALGRFIAKSAEKALPLFSTLKGEVSKEGFKWTPAADEAWQKLKQTLSQLPTLASPTPGETLFVYLSAAQEAISAVLVVERNTTQLPVYFVSRAL
ncbi:hypothetical protein L1887_41873 [Cichorium endivia]|nr:hypothetical protein L1887_41873 [Cichorium endivia]